MKELKYAAILKENQRLGEALKEERPYRIAVLSNVTVNQIKEILEYSLRLNNINAETRFGEYNTIVQDSAKYNNLDLIVIFWEASNLVAGGQYKTVLMDEKEISALIGRVRDEMELVFKNLKNSSLVLMNLFSSLLFNNWNLQSNNFDTVCAALNEHIELNKPPNTLLVDIVNVIAKISVEKAYDSRFFYSSKALYTIDFYKEYVRQILPALLSANGQAKKALVFDCDNTLWKGILGEDGIDKIAMSSQTPEGAVFEEVQSLALGLAKNGVLLGLCSKNNPQDVDEVLFSNQHMKIRDKDLVIKKVNWDDKVTNLKAIAQELNIGLDSIVFVDDSNFEVNMIRDNLPQVTVLQVPSRLSEYPGLLREHLGLFFSRSRTAEDLKKIEMYKAQASRQNERAKFHTLEEYLSSLEMKINMHVNALKFVPRIAQLTQKTNQFNLATKRYTETDIEEFIRSTESRVICFEVSDKFSDNGIVGVAIILLHDQHAEIDTFLMSCRVIGRNVEFAVFNWIVKYLKRLNVQTVLSTYCETLKNGQVKDFYEGIGFLLTEVSEKTKMYKADINSLKTNNLNYLEVTGGRAAD